MELATQSVSSVRLFAYPEQWEDLVRVCAQARRKVSVLDEEIGICIFQLGGVRVRLERLEREHPKTWALAVADVAVSFEIESSEKTREMLNLQLRAEHVYEFLRALMQDGCETTPELLASEPVRGDAMSFHLT